MGRAVLAAQGLSQITVDKVAEAMQVNSSNVMVGLEGRVSLLSNLGAALQSNPKFFGEDARPGNIIGAICVIPLFLNAHSWK